MKKCEYSDCKKKILSLVIDCNQCHKYFCGNHRIPESHECSYLSQIKQNAFQNNKNNLENNKINNTNSLLGTF